MRCKDRSFRRSTAVVVAACLTWATAGEGWAMARAAEARRGVVAADLKEGKDGKAESVGTAMSEMATFEAWARRAKLPPAAFARHAAAVAKIRSVAEGRLSADAPLARSLDPQRLPFRSLRQVKRAPGERFAALAATLGATGTAAGVLRAAPPTPADLAPTEEVQLTDEIRALAASLGNDPRRIYEWVKNEVEFVPTFGAVQGSQATLESRRGNAMDTASLLIALLRAAGVPARYVLGVANTSGAEARDAFGGMSSTLMAQQLAQAGGIAASAQTLGGEERLQFEHTWIEAYVDYVPGRGAAHGAGDTWLPLDAAWKVHAFAPPLSWVGAPPIADIIQPGDHLFSVDESLGRATEFDDRALSPRIETWLKDTLTFLASHQVPAGVDALVGGQAVRAENRSILPGSLPYRVVRTDVRAAALPASLRQTLSLEGFASAFDRAAGRRAFVASISFPALASRRLSVRFVPASPLDEQILATARATGAAALPIYLVRVVPRVELDGALLASGAPFPMGSAYLLDATLRGPSGSERVPFTVTAGDEIVVGAQAGEIQTASAERRLASHPVADAAEYLHQAQLQYFAAFATFADAAARALGARLVHQPSVGLFSAPLSVSTLYGVPFSGTYSSHAMDLQLLSVDAAAADARTAAGARRQAGFIASYLEGAIFERLEEPRDPDSGTGGLSAVSLLGAAAVQGIPLYRVTRDNLAAVLPHLELSAAVETDVANAVQQGRIALVPERNVDFGIWRGAGYVIEDPVSGAAGYLISGGTAGGALVNCVKSLVPAWLPVHVIAFAAALALLLAVTIVYFPQILEALIDAVQAFARLILMLRFLAPVGAAELAR
ncbi:MAG: transglutaminase-like domain-containing protein [Acidobacteriota bacterium]